MNFLKWHFFNLILIVLYTTLLGAIIWITATKITIQDDPSFFYRSWWHTILLIVLISGVFGWVVEILERRKPKEHSDKRENKAHQKSITRARKVREREVKRTLREREKGVERTLREHERVTRPVKQKTTSYAFFVGAALGWLAGKGDWSSDRYRIESWGSRRTGRQGMRGGTSGTEGNREKAIDKAYKKMKQNPQGEVKVIDQKTKNIILKLP